jgi:hypothetical protein
MKSVSPEPACHKSLPARKPAGTIVQKAATRIVDRDDKTASPGIENS